MAKKKATTRAPQRQTIILVYKADPQSADAYKGWLEGLAEHVGAPVTITLDMALKQFAESHKYKSPPKRLAPRRPER